MIPLWGLKLVFREWNIILETGIAIMTFLQQLFLASIQTPVDDRIFIDIWKQKIVKRFCFIYVVY